MGITLDAERRAGEATSRKQWNMSPSILPEHRAEKGSTRSRDKVRLPATRAGTVRKVKSPIRVQQTYVTRCSGRRGVVRQSMHCAQSDFLLFDFFSCADEPIKPLCEG